MSADPEFKRSETKFYVVTGVVIVLALAGFFLWSTNGGGITGAGVYEKVDEAKTLGITGNSGSISESGSSGKLLSGGGNTEEINTEASKIPLTTEPTEIANTVQKIPGIKLDLSLSAYPFFKKESTTIDNVKLEFLDLNTNININKEQLELDSLQGIKLNLNGFMGKVYLTEQGLSLEGTVNKIEVNGVALSSEAMRVAFDGLDYRYLYLGGIGLSEVQFTGGTGKLIAENEKVIYLLGDRDKIALSQFWGDITVNKDAETLLSVKGNAQDLRVSGDLELSLQ